MKGHLSEALIDELAETEEPSPALHGEALEHLALCALCTGELRLARMVQEALASVPRLEAPPELLSLVMQGVTAKRQASQRQTLIISVLAALAGVFIVVLWLLAGGAASLVIESLETLRSLELVTRIASSVWRTIPLELFALSLLVLTASSAALGRLVARLGRSQGATAEAS